VNPQMPWTMGDSFVSIYDLDILVPVDEPLIETSEFTFTDNVRSGEISPESADIARAIGEHIAPRITKAAAGRPAPRIVAGVPVTLCAKDEVDAARERANRVLGHAEYSPNYQRLLDYGDATDVGDILAAGDESAIVDRLRAFRDAGVTDLAVRVLSLGPDRAARVESRKRTEAFVASLCSQL